MAKAVSPAVGFNDNVRRRNRNFHVQTEDSGVTRPHIITHLFTDGGRIVKSVKQSYADIVHEEQLGKHVRDRMKLQHVGMLEALKSGEFDALVWGSRQPGKLKPDPLGTQPESGAMAAGSASGAAPSGVESGVQARTQSAPAPRRSTPPAPKKARTTLTPPSRKTLPPLDPALAPRARKSAPPKRRSSRPPARPSTRASVPNPREGLVAQTLDEVILRMLSEELDAGS